jgi:rhodanese-related sulfurtransferase
MPTRIFRDEVQRLLREERAQLVDVLPRKEFGDEHIAGAINIPLRELDAGATKRLDRCRPVIVY